ncbi:DNA/RNA non-specific endonuclease [Vagococcus elongatus]|uniref:Type VII secretion system protein EssD-like domain-containing protein n=1 Tax=Vagococcus elongatus TaxID=180344 RepID=A0A430ANJ5_9ENTE|nr:DNA/RNA non-specific endonuclease [Vagococcus elongatus]RSU09698.1 hypothetical protein CBF29_11010 [Vagococcus elongatus]
MKKKPYKKKSYKSSLARNKKKNKLFLIGAIVVLVLGLIGVELPKAMMDFFDVPEVGTVTKIQPDDQQTNNGSDEKASHFSAEDLAFEGKGWIAYGPLDKDQRATGADALITKEMIGTGTKANSNIRPPGFISGLAPHGHSRGHLIGKQFGGSGDDERNLVTLFQYPVNSPYMTKYENRIRQAVDQGETVRYRVTPLYDGNEPMPAAIQLEAKSISSNGSIDFDVTIMNKQEEE